MKIGKKIFVRYSIFANRASNEVSHLELVHDGLPDFVERKIV